ncbi:MAG TPA: GvpL/GvpF family gas vesicle protein [Thermoanaerobaculia bacterium]|nr:GvpL/GvpF family gas vesicle protein [Thermoanaerobaculia bacterium]
MPLPATYLYCLVRQPGEPALSEVPPGLPGLAPPRILAVAEGLWLVAASAPLPDFSGERIEERLIDLDWVSACALAHEAVVEHFRDAPALLPLKLFTLFASDERALAHLREKGDLLDRVLDRVAGRVEWGVRVRLDEARAREALAAEVRELAAPAGSGTSFLLRKKREQEASKDLAGRLRAEVEAGWEELAAAADEAERREPAAAPEQGGKVFLDAALLVPASRTAELEAAVGRFATRLAAKGGEVTLTGPWPPYHFVEEAR